jgi:hypothetical protein
MRQIIHLISSPDEAKRIIEPRWWYFECPMGSTLDGIEEEDSMEYTINKWLVVKGNPFGKCGDVSQKDL